jgi:hypothetical protein
MIPVNFDKFRMQCERNGNREIKKKKKLQNTTRDAPLGLLA